jgi:biopolymer transport protein ExbD
MKIARRRLEASVPAIAMGDIAFLLLIFLFILARANDTSHVRWKPALAEKVAPARQAMAEIAVDASNRLFFNGRETGIANLPALLEARLGDLPPGARVVHLKVDRNAKAQYFEPVIEAISTAGGDLVHILEEEPRKPASP